jgi:uncharacterized Ntn-hydrolase superfamily protein
VSASETAALLPWRGGGVSDAEPLARTRFQPVGLAAVERVIDDLDARIATGGRRRRDAAALGAWASAAADAGDDKHLRIADRRVDEAPALLWNIGERRRLLTSRQH